QYSPPRRPENQCPRANWKAVTNLRILPIPQDEAKCDDCQIESHGEYADAGRPDAGRVHAFVVFASAGFAERAGLGNGQCESERAAARFAGESGIAWTQSLEADGDRS